MTYCVNFSYKCGNISLCTNMLTLAFKLLLRYGIQVLHKALQVGHLSRQLLCTVRFLKQQYQELYQKRQKLTDHLVQILAIP